MHHSKAFTLAEVLIVLFLIGVFATFANPTVMQNPKIELRKLNATSDSVHSTSDADIFKDLPEKKIPINEDAKIEINKIAEYKDIHNTPININIAEVSKKNEKNNDIISETSKEIIKPNYHLLHTYLKKENNKKPIEQPLEDIYKTKTIYNFIKNPSEKNETEIGENILNLLPVIDSNCKKNCFAKKYKTISGKSYKTDIDSSTPKGILSNGARIAVVNGTKNKNFPIIKIYMDLNGTRPPNKRCRDLFEYELYPTLKTIQFFPAGKINNYTEVVFADKNKSTDTPTGTLKQIKYTDKQIKNFIYKQGKYCEIKIEHDGMKIKY